ncbi:MAG: hypothetical protein ABJA98_18375 [Acidobacteriota bacterium]
MKESTTAPEHAKAIARWENDGGAGKSPLEEARDAGEARAEKEHLRIRKVPRRRAK